MSNELEIAIRALERAQASANSTQYCELNKMILQLHGMLLRQRKAA